MQTQEDIHLILSGTRALWGSVTPPLRSVSIELKDETIIWKCAFDTNASEDDFELASDAAGEVIADFPNYNLEEIIIIVPDNIPTEPLENLIYLRHE